MKTLHNVFVLMAVIGLGCTSGQGLRESRESANYKFYLGSSLFVLANLTDVAPDFYQLNIGMHLTDADVIALELITWKYNFPLGIPFGPSFDNPDEEYPGYVREFGMGLVYQRFLWKRWYADVEALPLLQRYHNEQDKRIQNGFVLFLTLRSGYQLQFLKNRIFLEPSVAFNYWPINTNVPESFARKESRWPNYFLFEPGLHFGVKF